MKRYELDEIESAMYFGEIDSGETFIKYSEVEQLQALTKELCEYVGVMSYTPMKNIKLKCRCCGAMGSYDDIKHKEDCLVLKAQSHLDKEGV